ncbi:MAG: hypothetical protein KAH18_12880 [Psychromonas sp.]|nr:hypothetical protein [Psychromonas sp.]
MPLRSRSNSLIDRPLSTIPLAGSVLKLAYQVWEKKLNIKNPSDIYRLYAHRTKPNPLMYNSDIKMTMLLFKINALAKAWGQMVIADGFGSISLDTLTNALNHYLITHIPIENHQIKLAFTSAAERSGISLEDYFIVKMSRIGVIFKARSTNDTKYRVYLNVDPNNAIDVMSYVIFKILDVFNGARAAKIRIGNNSDTIIIYIKSITVTNQVIEKIRDYQKKHGDSAFRTELPAMTKFQMQGVSTAEQPPRIQITKHQVQPRKGGLPSFGTYRCELFYQALIDSKGFSEFIKLIMKYFKEAGIDANDPSIQTRSEELLQLSRINFSQQYLPDYW